MIVGSYPDATGSENDRPEPEVIIESEELMVEIDDIVVLREDFDEIVEFAGFPLFRSFR